jgi:hypothetical protein
MAVYCRSRHAELLSSPPGLGARAQRFAYARDVHNANLAGATWIRIKSALFTANEGSCATVLDPDAVNHLGHTVARRRCRYPHHRMIIIGKTIEAEREAVRRKEQRERSTKTVIQMIAHVETNDEIASHRPLEMDTEKEAEMRMPSARM